jgi:hypothetical protein
VAPAPSSETSAISKKPLAPRDEGQAPLRYPIPAAAAPGGAGADEPTRGELLRRLRAFRGRLPADFKFDREEANAGSLLDTNMFLHVASGNPAKADWAERLIRAGAGSACSY